MLERTSRRFDKTPMWDAYTGELLAAKCQVTAWDNPRRDGLTTIRRTLSMSSTAKLPQRRTLIIGGAVWLVARIDSPDTWGEHVSRVGYIAQQAVPGKVATTDTLVNDTGVETYLSRVWVKDVKDISTTSESQGQYYVYFTEGEAVAEGEFLFVDGRWHIVRNIVAGTAGLMIAECNELEHTCLAEVVIPTAGEYDPVTETYEVGTEQKVNVIRMQWKDDYDHKLPSREAEQIGDERLRVAAGDAHLFKHTTRLKLDGVMWQVVEIEKRREGAVSVVIRRA